MVWDVPHMLAFLSQYVRLLPGDLVFTGTPAGVGAVVVGDRLDGRIDGLTPLVDRDRRCGRLSMASAHGLTPEEVERGYNNRAAVPDHPHWLDAVRRALGSRASRRCVRRATSATAADRQETLDLFVPGKPARGTLMFIHGGYWRALDKADHAFVAPVVRRRRIRGRRRQLRPVPAA